MNNTHQAKEGKASIWDKYGRAGYGVDPEASVAELYADALCLEAVNAELLEACRFAEMWLKEAGMNDKELAGIRQAINKAERG